MADNLMVNWQNNTHRQWWRDPGLRRNVFSVMLLYFSNFAIGYDGAMMNGLQALPTWNKTFNNPSGSRLGLIVASIFFGQVGSAPIIYLLVNRLGRKTNIAIGSLVSIAGGLIGTFSQNQAMFIASRVIVGAAWRLPMIGAVCLINELIHPRLRGISAALLMATFAIGGLVATWLAFFCLRWNSDWQWRFPVLFQCMAPILLLVALLFTPESPRWLVHQGRHEEALSILAKYHANGDSQDELVQQEYKEIVKYVQSEKDAQDVHWRSLVEMTLAISGSTILGSGIARNYFTIILKSVGIKDPTHITATNGGISIWYTICTCAGAMLVDKAGRRSMYLMSTIGMLVSLCIITGLSAAFTMDHGTQPAVAISIIVLFFIFMGIHQAGWATLYTLYPVEILPFSIRTKGLVWANIADGLSLMFTTFADPVALKAIQWKYYLIFIGLEVVFIGLVWWLFLETKGCTIEQAALIFGPEDTISIQGNKRDQEVSPSLEKEFFAVEET
ncbi:general substrate transporter [Gymnopus androsaceus JB14]|uniref:General substrate transporter n=1 Tax=Gymnopus androsaceus JB14 TaxID=1447944 RepID=A0A6A4H326_9AGAR|nr:general substrate transporter [Gymnopus androsaceus JB14]